MRKPTRFRKGASSQPEALAWLDARMNYERTPAPNHSRVTFGLGRMRRLLAALGDPHRSCPSAHVAGTKGKGSTVTMLAAILQESGHRVGRYLSPHVYDVEERIAINGRPISRRQLTAVVERLMPVVDQLDREAARHGGRGPTWFEVMTASAFTHFADQSVDIAVLETGLGGRLDATNVCCPIVTVITSISYDHMKLLGSTLRSITTEKAGIIKRGCPIVSGATQPVARSVIRETAVRRRAPLLELGRDFTIQTVVTPTRQQDLKGVSFDLARHGSGDATRYTLRLAGSHQAENAGLAVIALEELRSRGIHVTDEAITRGLATATLPARIETISHRPLVVIDAAHNVASMSALAVALRPMLDVHTPKVLVFAASNDKQIEKMLKTSCGLFDHAILTRYVKNPRSAPIDRLVAACRAAGLANPAVASDPPEALRKARSLAGHNGIVVVAGSFFLAAEIGRLTRSC